MPADVVIGIVEEAETMIGNGLALEQREGEFTRRIANRLHFLRPALDVQRLKFDAINKLFFGVGQRNGTNSHLEHRVLSIGKTTIYQQFSLATYYGATV